MISKEINIEKLFENGEKYIGPTQGISMRPMLNTNKTTVVIDKIKKPLKKYDVVLYRRNTQYVLHRIIDYKDGIYCILGDNTYTKEYVKESDIIGILVGYFRLGKEMSLTSKKYKKYVVRRFKTFKIRRFFVILKTKIKNIIKKIIRYDKRKKQ